MRVVLAVLSVWGFALLATRALIAEQPAEAPAPAYLVIVHPDNPVTMVGRKFLADVFLKKVGRWPNELAIRPADLVPASETRSRFSKRVLKRSVAAVQAYWQQRIFSGRGVPPPEFDREEQIVTYVLRHRGAVGYVSGTADLHDAKVVRVEP